MNQKVTSALKNHAVSIAFIMTALVVFFFGIIQIHSAHASTQTISSGALQSLPADAQWNEGVNFRPGNGDVVTTNPPQFSWLYAPDPTDNNNVNYKGDVEAKQFIFQTSYYSSFTNSGSPSYINNVETPLNFYNTIAPFNAGSTVYWRIGYIHSGATTPYVWSRTRSFTVASNATTWDRSMLDDSGSGPLSSYLASRSAHPHLLFTSATQPALVAWLNGQVTSQTDTGKSYAVAITDANRAIAYSWWNNHDNSASPTSAPEDPQTWAGDIGDVAFVYSMTQDPKYLNTGGTGSLQQQLVNLAEYYVAEGGPTTDYISLGAFGTEFTTLGFGYDWLYNTMTAAQQATVLNALSLRAAWVIEGNYGIFYYPPNVDGQVGVVSFFKMGFSHGIDNLNESMIAALAGYGDSPQLRQLFDFGINYMLGVTFNYGTDGSAWEGRAYSSGSLFNDRATLANHVIAQEVFPEAQFNLNPYWTAATNWWDAMEPVNWIAGHDAWGDTGTGAMVLWQYPSFGRDLGYFLNSSPATQSEASIAYQHWINEYNDSLLPGAYNGASINFYELPIPYDFTQAVGVSPPSQANSTALNQFYPDGGWAIGCSQPQDTLGCYNNGVGYALEARPSGGQWQHDYYNDLSYQLWAYGTAITDAGGIYNSNDAYEKTPIASYSLLVNGLGTCGTTNPVHTFYNRIYAYATTTDYAYMAADGTNSYPTSTSNACKNTGDTVFGSAYNGGPLSSIGLQKVERHILFVKNKYFVIYDDFASQQPATFTSLYHILENTASTTYTTTTGGFSYTSNIQSYLGSQTWLSDYYDYSKTVPTTTVEVQYINAPATLNIQDQTGAQVFANPIVSSENYDPSLSLNPSVTGESLPRAHAIWTSNATPSTSFHIMTVIYPVPPGVSTSTIHIVPVGTAGDTASVTDNSGTDVISFNPSTASGNGATMIVDLPDMTPLAVTDDVNGNGATTTSVSYTAPTIITTAPPAITSVSTSSISSNSAVVSWATDEPATTVVNYGLNKSYASSTGLLSPSTVHSQALTGLIPSTTYHYQVMSTDYSNNTATTSDATFTTAPSNTYTISITPPSNGTITSSDGSISCGGTCSSAFATGTVVTLTETPASGYTFSSWGGNCSGTQTTCSLTLTSGMSVSATFTAVVIPPSGGSCCSGGGGGGGTSYLTLTVHKQGNGFGTTTSSPSSISCGLDCVGSFPSGSTVVLIASSTKGSSLASWTGCTSIATSTCTVILTSATTIGVDFVIGTTTSPVVNIAPLTIPSASVIGCPTGFTCTPLSGSSSFITSSNAVLTQSLSLGSIDPQVKILQEILNNNGFTVAVAGNGSSEHETDYFGPATLLAVERFQCSTLAVCSTTPGYGLVGHRTRTALNTLSNPPPSSQPTISNPPSSAAVSSTATLSLFVTPLKLGMFNSEVKNLQIFLNTHGFLVATTGNGSSGHETDYFGPATSAAVIRFQNAYAAEILAPYGLTKGTGYFGSATMKEMNSLELD